MTGNGAAMRAGIMIEALAAHYRVTLHVQPLYLSRENGIPAEIVAFCESSHMAKTAPTRQGLQTQQSSWWKLLIHRPPAHRAFDVIHIFRLPAWRYALDLAGRIQGQPQWHLDLDDFESQTHARLAELARTNGDSEMVEAELKLVAQTADLEQAALLHMDCVFVCTEKDRLALLPGARAEIRIVPNAMRPPIKVEPKITGEPYTFLFVGTLGYYPNDDAVRYFSREILPRLESIASRRFQFVVIGFGASRSLQELGAHPRVRIAGEVPDVTPWYRDADVVVIPVRAGGGTRIKALEAFAYERPVVSTSIGVEGLAVQHEEHVLIADDPDKFARLCVELMTHPAYSARLTANARELVRREYSVDVVRRAVGMVDQAWNYSES